MRVRNLASLLPLAIWPACATQLPLCWTDPHLGFSVHTDFAPHYAATLFDERASRKLAALCRTASANACCEACVPPAAGCRRRNC